MGKSSGSDRKGMKNDGFANLDTKLDELGMINVAAFINFRLAKEDLGEFVEEIDD